MYTSRKQTEHLIDSGINPESADMMVIAGRGKDPFANWNPIAKTPENCKKYLGKDFMPAWSDEALINILPREVIDPDRVVDDHFTGEEVNIRYDLNIKKRIIPGRGKFNLVSYNDPTGGPMHAAYLSPSLTEALVLMTVEMMCNREKNLTNYVW